MDDRTTTDVAANPLSTFDLGAWIGRGQAFSFVANHCSAAQAECLTRIRKDGLYKALNLTWDEFCKQHAGASRAHADEIIRRLEEFGAAYFRLSEIIRISPQSYRTMQATVKGGAIEVGGGMVPLAFMPKWMAQIGVVSPVHWGILAIEGATWRGFTLPEMLLPCAILVSIGVVCFAIGTKTLRLS